MSLLDSVLLGIVQGLGEFLPISSSAHLVIFPWLLKFSDPGLSFDVALHFGTLFAIGTYFWRDWLQIFTSNHRLLFFLILSTLPGAVAGFFLDDLAETAFRHPLLIAGTMSLLGIVLFYADTLPQKNKHSDQINLKESLIMGFAQMLALVPGVSRSGVTITAALFCGLDRAQSARFSFLMATPITLGACVMKADDFIQGQPDVTALIGIIVSAVVGFLSIKYLLLYVQKFSYRIFVYYRFAFTLLVGVIYFWRLS